MLDNILFRHVVAVIEAGLPSVNLAGLLITQDYQPTQQGVPTPATLFFNKIGGDVAYGSPEVKDVWNTDTSTFDHIESQQYESMLQFSALSTQNPNTPDQLTASDILNGVRYTLQSAAAIAALQLLDIGVLRITQIRNPAFKDDRDQFENNPSFDLTVTHKQVVITSSPFVTAEEFQLLRV